MKNKIVLVELVKRYTPKFTVYQRELLIQLIKRRTKRSIQTVKIGKQNRRIIKTQEVSNHKVMKSLINEIQAKGTKACKVSAGLFNDLLDTFNAFFNNIKKPETNKQIKVLIHRFIHSSRQRAELLKTISELQGGLS